MSTFKCPKQLELCCIYCWVAYVICTEYIFIANVSEDKSKVKVGFTETWMLIWWKHTYVVHYFIYNHFSQSHILTHWRQQIPQSHTTSRHHQTSFVLNALIDVMKQQKLHTLVFKLFDLANPNHTLTVVCFQQPHFCNMSVLVGILSEMQQK